MFVKSLLRLHRYRKFDYRPRYLDNTRDKINELKIQKGYEVTEVKPGSKFRRESTIKNWNNSRNIATSSSSSLRIAFIFAILCFVCYIILRVAK
jgi:hypothetical protein